MTVGTYTKDRAGSYERAVQRNMAILNEGLQFRLLAGDRPEKYRYYT